MPPRITPITPDEHARLPIAFEVRRLLDVVPQEAGLGGLALVERAVDPPWTKDYDALDGGPLSWPARFDLARWALLGAHRDDRLVGAAAVALGDPRLPAHDGRADAAVLHDLRVAPAARGRGIGAALLDAAERWAAERGARWLDAETQTINVPACRLYARAGCTLVLIDRVAYPALPGEGRLVWRKRVGAGD